MDFEGEFTVRIRIFAAQNTAEICAPTPTKDTTTI